MITNAFFVPKGEAIVPCFMNH
uniref:Uncharacterized protein n=1 Tax=Rhizophora mucronata TaxID=61149 RepID=A0A2P2QTN5_RHIMU